MTNEEKAKMDQALSNMRDSTPRIWFALYQGAIATGFNEIQAFSLVQTWILAQNPNGIRPNDQYGPKGDE